MKKTFKLRTILTTLAVLAFVFSLAGLAPEAVGKTLLKVPTDSPPEFPNTKAWEVFKQYVESNSGGEFEVKIYHSAQLGDSQKIMEATKMGVYKIAQHDNGICGAYAPMSVWQIPYLFADEVVCREYFKSKAFQEINERMAKDLELRILGATPYGFYCFLNKKRPITKLEDLKGLKFRSLPGSEIEIVTMKALGISPTPTGWNEIYTSLKTGVIDGLPHALIVHKIAKFYEVAKYLTVDFSFTGASTYQVNEKWWQSLSKEQQNIIQRGVDLGVEVESGGSIYNNRVPVLKELADAGVKINYLSPTEKARIKKVAQKAATEFLAKKVGQESIDKTMHAIEAIEKRLNNE